jgi:MFS family permease
VPILIAVVLGLPAGWLRAHLNHSAWLIPDFRHAWLVTVFFVPQLFAFYLPATRSQMSTPVVAACLITSQIGLLLFCLYNKHLPGIAILAAGLFLNLLAISANGGLMPLSTTTAAYLVPEKILSGLSIGSRFGSSKDILLLPSAILFPWLSDCFVSPDWLPYRFIFSFGDVLIAIGAFLLLYSPSKILDPIERKVETKDVNNPVI